MSRACDEMEINTYFLYGISDGSIISRQIFGDLRSHSGIAQSSNGGSTHAGDDTKGRRNGCCHG